MADQRNPDSDVIGGANNNGNNSNNANNQNNQSRFNQTAETELLRSIEQLLRQMESGGAGSASQASVRDVINGSRGRSSRDVEDIRNPSGRGRRRIPNSGDLFGDVLDGFEEGLRESLLGDNYRENIHKTLQGFADKFGVEIGEIPGLLGKELSKQALSAIKGNVLGRKLSDAVGNLRDRALSGLENSFNNRVDRYNERNGTNVDFRDIFENLRNSRRNEDSDDSSNDDAGERARRSGSAGRGPEDFVDDLDDLGDQYQSFINRLTGDGDDLVDNLRRVGNGAGGLGDDLIRAAGGAASMQEAAAAAASVVGKFVAPIAIATVALAAFSPALEGLVGLFGALSDVGDRYYKERKEFMKNASERLKADTESMLKAPFELLEKAAQAAYDAWDANIRLINGTQGYTKSDLQDLMASFSARLRSEGLSSVISATDLTDNLASVLKSGLSGPLAEEFAYLATKLNAAIPNQDFFGYAETYASVAATAMQSWASQAEAIKQANQQLESFANNVLYASRQLSGGFSTGLQNAQDLFQQSVKIAQAARTQNATEISGVLTSVAAVTSSIAPDLASSIVEAITNAATGGNSSEIVALRSLAGINASNTEFLKAFAEDPKKIFSTLFTNLSKMQNMAPGAYMEVAEGLSSIFGMSMDALSRVDFNYLATAINNMNTNSGSLDQNLALLASGQTTTTAEMLKMQQINEYLIDEGLAYVMDNETARAIQQHMWDEQLANKLMDAEYAVNLHGAALEFLEGLKHAVENILNILNPIGWLIKKVDQLTTTVEQYEEQENAIIKLLKAGVVGQGNAKEFYELTTRGVDLNLTPTIESLYEGQAKFGSTWLSGYIDKMEQRDNGIFSNWILSGSGLNQFLDNWVHTGTSGEGISSSTRPSFGNGDHSPTSTGQGFGQGSAFGWSMMGKSIANALANTSFNRTDGSSYKDLMDTPKAKNPVDQYKDQIAQALSNESMRAAIQQGKSYKEYTQEVSKQYNIADWNKALKDLNYTVADVESAYLQNQTVEGNVIQEKRAADEEDFWNTLKENTGKMVELLEQANRYQEEIIRLLGITNTWLEGIYNKELELISLLNTTNSLLVENNAKLDKLHMTLNDFKGLWTDYWVNHTAYNEAYSYSDVERVKQEAIAKDSASKEDAVYALAEALTKNSVDLRDPAVQTNALLSQILIVVQAIMQQNNDTVGGNSLIESLSALSMGLTVKNE